MPQCHLLLSRTFFSEHLLMPLFAMQEQPFFVLLYLVCLNLLLSFELRGSTWQLLTCFVCSGRLHAMLLASQPSSLCSCCGLGQKLLLSFELEGSTRQILTLCVIFGCQLGTSEVCEYLLKLGDFRDLARIDVLSGSLASILRAVGKANNISSRSLAGPFHCRIQHSLRVIGHWTNQELTDSRTKIHELRFTNYLDSRTTIHELRFRNYADSRTTIHELPRFRNYDSRTIRFKN